MIIFPAIVLHHGRIVLSGKNPSLPPTANGSDPTAIARYWASQGAEWLHVVDLDAAGCIRRQKGQAVNWSANVLVQKPGEELLQLPTHPPEIKELPANLQKLYEIRRSVTLPIQFGGGLRTLEDIELAFKLGATRVILGMPAVENSDLVGAAIQRWGAEKIVVGLEAKDGAVVTHGGPNAPKICAVDLGHHMHALGIRRVVYTDVTRHGKLCGVDATTISRMGDLTDLRVIARGGVSSMEDVELLKSYEHYNIEGVVIGTSLYRGTVELAEAIRVGKRPLTRESAGLVPFRRTKNGPEFLLLFNLFLEQWQFPRGGLQGNEIETKCAVREFVEETGMGIVRLYRDCRTILQYTSSIRGYEIERTIVYFLAEIKPSEIHLGNENHCEARWLPYRDAWELLTETSPEQLPALDRAMAFLSQNL